MAKKFKRNLFLNVNRFQKNILYPVLISCAVVCLLGLVCLGYLYAKPFKSVSYQTSGYHALHFSIPWFLLVISFVLFFIVIWTYYISNKMVGPYERVLRELDDILAGKKKQPVYARKGDEIFQELLKRINALIERIP